MYHDSILFANLEMVHEWPNFKLLAKFVIKNPNFLIMILPHSSHHSSFVLY
jgi:hypothetical protein